MREVHDHSFNVNAAKARGHEKAILLKEIYGWVKHNWDGQRNIHHGVAWTYSSAKVYQEKFPYFSERSISRWLAELEKEGFIASANFNEHKYDRTKWYTINVDAYLGICSNCDADYLVASLNAFLKFFSKLATSKRQNGEGFSQDGEGFSQDGEPIPSLTISLTSPDLSPPQKTKKENKEKGAVQEVIDYLNTKANTSFKATTKETIQFVTARQKVDGWELEDFKLIIDFKVHDWGKDDRMKQYICPSTLFRASNAEKYMQAAKAWRESFKVGQNGQIRYSKEEPKSTVKYDRVLPTPKINRV